MALINSCGVLAGKSLLTATMNGPWATIATGAKLFTASNGSLLWMAALVVMLEDTATSV
ncbi:hypothetical protein D3C87_1283820 [compost metagenome]